MCATLNDHTHGAEAGGNTAVFMLNINPLCYLELNPELNTAYGASSPCSLFDYQGTLRDTQYE